jgi:predicted O-methyltransferase YrrM
MRDRSQLVRRLALRDPRLLVDYVQLSLRSRLGGEVRKEPSGITAALTPEEARRHIAAKCGDWSEGPALTRTRQWRPADASGRAAATAARLAGDASFAELLYGLVRALRPDAVVETGVATGVTSAYLLAALADNGKGELRSIDLPSADLLRAGIVGCSVPAELRDRWTYHLGASRRLLPRVFDDATGARRLFVHDSEHTYSNMRWELECAWRALAKGDWLVADDAQLHSAFADVAAAVGAEARFVEKVHKGGCLGLMVKERAGDARCSP